MPGSTNQPSPVSSQRSSSTRCRRLDATAAAQITHMLPAKSIRKSAALRDVEVNGHTAKVVALKGRVSPKRRGGRKSAQPALRSDGEITRTRILDAAERLFSVGGYTGVSLREITAEAEVDLALI